MRNNQQKAVRKILSELRHSMPDVGTLKVTTQTSPDGNFLFVLTYEGTSGAGETVAEAQANLRQRLPLAKDRMIAHAEAMEKVATELRRKANELDGPGLAAMLEQAKNDLAGPMTDPQGQETTQ